MPNLAKVNNRQINFEVYDTSKNWIANFPNEKWCLIIVAEEENRNYFDEIIRKAIDRNVAYICCVGEPHDLIHDLADEELVFRDVENLYLPQHLIMTTGHEDFEKGIWFGIYTTESNETEIEQIIILDLTKRAFEKTAKLVREFEAGYVPEN